MMALTYSSTRDRPRHFEPGKGFGSPFAYSGLAAAGSVAHRALCDEPKELAGFGIAGPAAPHLYGVFEGQFAWVNTRRVGRLRHQQPDQIVGCAEQRVVQEGEVPLTPE